MATLIPVGELTIPCVIEDLEGVYQVTHREPREIGGNSFFSLTMIELDEEGAREYLYHSTEEIPVVAGTKILTIYRNSHYAKRYHWELIDHTSTVMAGIADEMEEIFASVNRFDYVYRVNIITDTHDAPDSK